MASIFNDSDPFCPFCPTIDHEIGAGGMATVYLARDVRHNRKVALKVPNPELGAVLGK